MSRSRTPVCRCGHGVDYHHIEWYGRLGRWAVRCCLCDSLVPAPMPPWHDFAAEVTA